MWLFALTSARSLSFTISSILQDLPRDDQPLNLAGSLANGAQLHITIELLGGIVLDEPVAAVNLNSFVGTLHCDLARVQLRHRGFKGGFHSRVFHCSSAIRKQAGGIDLSRQIGKFERNALKIAYRLPELFALLGVLQRSFVRALSHAESKRGDGDAAAIEYAHGIHEAFAFVPQQVFSRNFAVLKDQLRGVAGAESQLVLLLASAKSLGSLLHHEG